MQHHDGGKQHRRSVTGLQLGERRRRLFRRYKFAAPAGLLCSSGGAHLQRRASGGTHCSSGGRDSFAAPAGHICSSGGTPLQLRRPGLLCSSGGTHLQLRRGLLFCSDTAQPRGLYHRIWPLAAMATAVSSSTGRHLQPRGQLVESTVTLCSVDTGRL
jgi:hypothetical protein